MTSQNSKTETKETCHHGIPMSDEELAETIQCWKDIEECFNNLEIIGEDENNE